MAYVPEDRTHVGTAPSLSITDNVIMKKYQQPPDRARPDGRCQSRREISRIN